MIIKKVFFILFIFTFLGACTSPTAILGPVYTFTSSGNIAQAGFSYGSGELIKKHTGESTFKNLQNFRSQDLIKKNIQKKTLKIEDFYNLVKSKIEKTSGILKLSIQ